MYNTAITSINKITSRGEEAFNEITSGNNQNVIYEADHIDEVQEQRHLVNKAVEQLPKNEAIVVTLYYMEEYSVSEISEIMSLTKSNVKIMLFRARKKLHDILN